MSKLKKSLLIVFLILLADQVFKIWIKTNMYLGEEFPVIGNWFLIHFVENNGWPSDLSLPESMARSF
jgi:signal peptidase II